LILLLNLTDRCRQHSSNSFTYAHVFNWAILLFDRTLILNSWTICFFWNQNCIFETDCFLTHKQFIISLIIFCALWSAECRAKDSGRGVFSPNNLWQAFSCLCLTKYSMHLLCTFVHHQWIYWFMFLPSFFGCLFSLPFFPVVIVKLCCSVTYLHFYFTFYFFMLSFFYSQFFCM